jgi:hypothetical protein
MSSGGGSAFPINNAGQPFNYNQGGIFGASANALNQAGQGTAQYLGYKPMMVNYSSGLPTYGLQTPQIKQNYRPYKYTPMNVSGQGYDAAQLAGTDLSPYMNPYESQVIGNVTRDLSDAQQMQQNLASAQAGAAGAFGGSRHALMEAQTVKDYMQNVGNVTSQLRQQGFQNAQQAALADIAALNRAGEFGAAQDMQAQLANQQAQAQAKQFYGNQLLAKRQADLQAQMANQGAYLQGMGLSQQDASMALKAQLANQQAQLSGAGLGLSAANQLANISNLGFGQGQAMQGGLAQMGGQQQAQQQAIMDAAQGLFQGFTNRPNDILGILGSIGGMYPGVTGQTQTKKPGLFDYLGMAAGLAGTAGTLGWAPFSDYRLKEDIKFAGKTASGINLYTWKWNDEAKRIGATVHPTYGVIAQELEKTTPSAVMRGRDGYLRVDYSKVF